MGYSLSVAVDKKLKKGLDAFLEEHFVPFSKVLPEVQKHDYAGLREDPSYAPKNVSVVGFDFNASGPERDYIFAIVRTLALTLETKKSIKENKDLQEHHEFRHKNSTKHLFYYFYDQEPMFIYTPEDARLLPESWQRQCVVDENARNKSDGPWLTDVPHKFIDEKINKALAEFRSNLTAWLSAHKKGR